MDKPKVLQLITGLNPGGAEKVVFDLSLYLNNNGFDVHVIGLSELDRLLQNFLDNKINARVLKLTKNPWLFIKGLFAVNKFIKQNNIKLIHAHLMHALIFASLLKIINPSLSVVFTSHSFNIGSKIRFGIVKFLKPFRKADILFSEKMRRPCYKSDALIIPNGINVESYATSYIKYPKFTFLCIGRLEHVKNQKCLIDFAACLKHQFEFEIKLVGDGVLRAQLMQYAQEQGVADVVDFCGFSNNIAEMCARAHVFLMPSLWEGLPISLLEAGASGLPVLATPVGSIPEVITPAHGYLAEAALFPQMMLHIYENYAEATAKAAALKILVKEKYSLDGIAQKHINLYKSMLID
ncbi:glycosyltransferase family 4 protein [Mucilaginibacter polytrichastri]|uniref:Glycosyltransferase subfamily 4-like N-terminal domain-containing protein n=1 Tax=Mucilaginibacter polytrichastri TaxID=1302689 RepID=A0A1Q6A371_9SPHI|nr:glycosyltransferase family 4 protein [Mucilaginibacter polytrichastri]OKS88460.1 hypothetical protein RG47T_3927 [Mucilaginibacter polytrichastri]SFT12391.1 Glycosyltransferase involved in cell wall bisynthesis [Mucilaginibacter polytrichastri]